MKPNAAAGLLACLLLPFSAPAAALAGSAAGMETGRACVVLLHGMGRTSHSMEPMAKALRSAGYRVCNTDYPSRDDSVQELARSVVPEALSTCRATGPETVHFVTHSLGGLLVRFYLEKHSIPELGRIVMLSPPNQGSEAADALKDNFLYRWFNGPAGQQLGTGPDGIAARLGPVRVPVGVITGSEHAFFDGWLSEIIPGADDGKVSVQRAQVEGMADFLVVPHAHSFIMEKEEVISQTLHFLTHGRFRRNSTDSDPPRP
jgi:triacylglycerol lipase